MAVFGVWVQPVDSEITPDNLDKYGSVHDITAEYGDDDSGTPNKQFCDGQTSLTPPRYATDQMVSIYTRSREAANEISQMLREDVMLRMCNGDIPMLAFPQWVGRQELEFMINQFKHGSDFKVIDASLSSRVRNQMQSDAWNEYMQSDAGQRLRIIKRYYDIILQQEDIAQGALEYQLQQSWQGNRRVANWVENRLKTSGVEYRRIDALSGSIYFESGEFKLRIADHIDVHRSSSNTRFLPTTHEATPFTARWSDVVENFISALKGK
jgi:hypothetical protein